jgi:hypothetical protein
LRLQMTKKIPMAFAQLAYPLFGIPGLPECITKFEILPLDLNSIVTFRVEFYPTQEIVEAVSTRWVTVCEESVLVRKDSITEHQASEAVVQGVANA